MGSVRVVTDSAANIPGELAARHHIEVVPLQVLFGNEAYAEDVELSKDEFYRRLKASSVLPRTSQPSAGDFAAVYERLAGEGAEIVSIHISRQLSGTVASAEAARAMLPETKIAVIDSLSVSMGQGLLAVQAARAAEEGRTHDEIVRLVERLIPRVRVMFVVDTLEYLQKGGRIGGATAFLGSLLNVKPMMAIRDGHVEPLERVRTKARAIERLTNLMAEEVKPADALHAAVLHGQAPAEAADLQASIAKRFNCRELLVTEIGPVIATHAGPGVVGLAFYVEP